MANDKETAQRVADLLTKGRKKSYYIDLSSFTVDAYSEGEAGIIADKMINDGSINPLLEINNIEEV